MNIAERGAYWARWRPDGVAIRAADTDLTWREIADRVARVANGLAQRGIEPGDRIGILGANSTEWCVLALAALHRGAIVVPLNIRYAPPELAGVLDHSGCKVVAYDEKMADLFAAAEPQNGPALTISLDGTANAEARFEDLVRAEPTSLVPRGTDDVAVIGYTSGTTGLPKGAMLTHGNLAATALQTALAEGSTHTRRTLLCIPLAFTGGIVNNFLATYAVGGALALEPAFVPDRVIEVLEKERITTWFAVPVMWQAITATERFAASDLSALDSAICGGAPVPSELLEVFHAKNVTIRQAYGLTEATGSVAYLPAALALEKPEAAGLPNIHTHVRLVDDDGRDVATGEVGEIIVQGPQVMAGYWEDAQATAETLRDGWLYTGDLARFDENGLMQIVDRKKSMFISGGLNVYPAEIERIVEGLPDVEECAAFGLPHERWGEACAVVVRGRVDEESLVEYCRKHLADYKVPRTIIYTGEPLPRGMSGKILRGRLPELYG